MMKNWSFGEVDREIARDVQGFLPERVFDIHAHLYNRGDLNYSEANLYSEGPPMVTAETWRTMIGRQVGEHRLQGALFIATPSPDGDTAKANAFIAAEIRKHPEFRGLILVEPDGNADAVRTCLDNPGIVGFKPYHFYSRRKPTLQAPLGSYLPEWVWKLADERGLVITLHMVRDRALADPDNQREIIAMCRKYPGARLILAHAARGFHAPNTLAGIESLRGLDNVWFDTAAVCESAAILAILREFGPRKVVWGSDFPISESLGRCVTAGNGFVWLDDRSVDWSKLAPGCIPALVGLESLRAMKEVADSFPLTAEDLTDIFCDNARRLLGLKKESGTLTQDRYRHAKERIPGGTQLLSKRPEMLAPNQWPAYFREARGCEIWDLDGRHYYDFATNGIGACLLGYRDPDVTRAVQRRVALGSMCTLNPPEEVELADRLCEIHPWAEQVRFTRSGGEAGAVVIRIVRATTDRSLVAICGYHGWQDWYLAANLGQDDALRGHLLPGLDPLGVPRELRGTALTFRYNDREAFDTILRTQGDRLAAVIMEPCRYQDPEPGFLEYVRDGAHRCGALLIFDEITIGWRLTFGGSHLKLGVNPDLAIFAKALGNGHPIGTVIGTRTAMAGAQSSFISSTYWTEGVGPAAAVATLEKMKQTRVWEHAERVGTAVKAAWTRAAAKYKVPAVVEPGYPCLAHFRFDHELANELRTLYTQLMLKEGILAGTAIYPTQAHTDAIVGVYAAAVDKVFAAIADVIAKGKIKESLTGPPAHTGFRRLL